MSTEESDIIRYYQIKIAKALEALERGDNKTALQVLRGEVVRCECGEWKTIDHICPKGDNT